MCKETMTLLILNLGNTWGFTRISRETKQLTLIADLHQSANVSNVSKNRSLEIEYYNRHKMGHYKIDCADF